jgi:hypothetical protein
MTRFSLSGLVVVSLLLSACGASAPAATNSPSEMPQPSTAAPAPSTSPSETACQGIGNLEALSVGAACWIDIATDDDTPIRVRYTIPAPGWFAFIGTAKDAGEGQDAERVGVLIADIKNLTIDACDQQTPATPPVGPTVEDLAAALTELPPFEVSSPPADVTAYGYSGTHLQTRIPLDQPFDEEFRTFSGCTLGDLASWMSPPLNPAFYGYVAPGDTEDFWILDVEGTRVVIATLATANASDELIAEQEAVLDSIVIEP